MAPKVKVTFSLPLLCIFYTHIVNKPPRSPLTAMSPAMANKSRPLASEVFSSGIITIEIGSQAKEY
ncbi:hypothetical protein NX059_008946 [Plenodomus lindquistii]|nr:hypothetical protein NX059_008946 [Plenodomus lindquistii]